ncbi:MAG: cysteine hydrolase [Acidimicrobiia bacterium]|nr:cysteine hydrolase [Acidimicrobiia bacterium]MDH5520441.1 cysteine hydrolase [Acidimicrobiia bacterium]
MQVVHPSPEIPQGLVDKIVAQRGRLHVHDRFDPSRTALIVVDMDVGSCAREPESTAAAIERINAVSSPLRSAGGTVAFVTSEIADPADLARRLGDQRAAMYQREARSGGVGTILTAALTTTDQDLRARKAGASAFFPGRCNLHEQLQVRRITSLLIAGLVTNVCCESSARDACELGYEVTMVSDAMVGQSFGLHEASLSTFFRVFGDVRPASDVVRLISGFERSS